MSGKSSHFSGIIQRHSMGLTAQKVVHRMLEAFGLRSCRTHTLGLQFQEIAANPAEQQIVLMYEFHPP